MSRRIALVLIALILGFYALWAGSAIRVLSVTVDEPLHTVGAYLVRHQGDYRVNREDPPLWLHWVGLFLSKEDISASYTQADWAASKFGVDDQSAYLRQAIWTQTPQPEASVKKSALRHAACFHISGYFHGIYRMEGRRAEVG